MSNNNVKGILDGIYGFIPLSPQILSLIDLPVFQRLRHIKQLTSAQYVFMGSNHTRFEHSIGVSHLARRYGEHLFSNFPKEQKDKMTLILQISGLWHDICHCSYSHAWDSAIYSKIYGILDAGHDEHRLRLLHEVLKKPLEDLNLTCDDIENVWEEKNSLLSAVLHGPGGCDRADFIRRDTTYCNTSHFGIIDVDRIIYNSMIYEKEGKQVLSYNTKIVNDLTQGLRSRLDMYLRVYLHKKVVAAGVIIEAMINSACDILDLVGRTQDLDKFMYLTDDFVLHEILSSTDDRLAEARIYAKALYTRTLPKMISEKKIEVKNAKFLPTTNVEILTPAVNDIREFKCIWRSRILSNDFIKEFAKHDIHVYEGDKHIPFAEYYKPDFIVSDYYLERVYSYES
jgi:HD superfamily phosphohydrolase